MINNQNHSRHPELDSRHSVLDTESKTPKLRFKEFSGEWKEKKLGDVAKISAGGTPSRTNQNYWNGHIPWVSTTLIDFNTINETDELITEEGLKNSSAKLFPIGTILMAMYGQGKTRGKVGLLGIEASTNQACGAIIADDTKLISLFLFQNLAKRYDEIRDLSNQGGQENLSGGIIKAIPISFPSKPEQQKIASFLSAIDTKIDQMTRKKVLLEQYKKGVMQKIFSQELRFKADDGSEFPKWEEKILGDLIEIVVDNRGKTPPIAEDGIALIEVNAIGNKQINYSKITKFVTDDTHNTWFRKYLKNGDVLFSTVGQTAICSIYLDDVKAVIAQNIVGLRFCSDDFVFMYYMLTELNNHRKFKAIEMGAVQPSIKVSQMIELQFFVPKSVEEQTKIANFLSAIDTKIDLVTKQLEEVKQFKKALLQQMFV
ncbi:MAG: restriction endonuclease subunit S [Sulfuricurvum sp.]